MAFFDNNKLKVLEIVALCLLLLGAFIFGDKVGRQKSIKECEKEQVELQNRIVDLEQYLSDQQEATALAVEELDQVKKSYGLSIGRLQTKLQKTQEGYAKVLREMESLEAPELEIYFNERYPEDSNWVGEQFRLPVGVGNRVRYDLTDRDFCVEESELKDSVLLEQSRYIDTLSTLSQQVLSERNYLSGKVSTLEQYGTDLENRNLLLEKNLKCQKIQKSIFITTTSILGILLVTSIILGGK